MNSNKWRWLCAAIVLASSNATVQADSRVAEAARTADVNAVRALVKQRADVNGLEADGSTALLWATYRIDLDMVKAVIATRMHILRDYAARVTLPVLKAEAQRSAGALSLRVRKLLVRHPQLLDSQARARLQDVLAQNKMLQTVHEFRERLSQLWSGALGSNERLVVHLNEWVAQAEASGIDSLQQFAARLRGYRLQPVATA